MLRIRRIDRTFEFYEETSDGVLTRVAVLQVDSLYREDIPGLLAEAMKRLPKAIGNSSVLRCNDMNDKPETEAPQTPDLEVKTP